MSRRDPNRLPLGKWEGIRWIRLRAALLAVGLLACLLLVLGRAVHLQVVQRDWLGGLAQGQYTRTLELSPHRGEIVDRQGATLASSVEVDSIFIDPLLLGADEEERRAAFEAIARAAAIDGERKARLAARLEVPGSRFFWLWRKAPPTVSERVRALDLRGVGFVKEAKRFYPQRELASQVLGFVGADGHGLEGIERALDQELYGKGASLAALRDARGRALLSEASVPTGLRTGATVTLTLDRNIQYLAEKALADGMREQGARAGTAVVMDVETGELLAIASLPTYNPNVGPTGGTRQGARLRAVTDPFEPGSTVKAFVLAGALERGRIRADQAFDCENGVWRVGRHRVHDSRRYRSLTPPRMLQVSSNICLGKVAQLLGPEEVEAIYRSFGLGRRSGIELPGEAGGLVGPFPGEIELVTAAFGQGPLMATSLQVAAGFAALGNGGTLLTPWLVRTVETADGVVRERGAPQVAGQPVGAETAEAILRWLELAVQQGGTGTLAALEGYPVAGKTGTSQKVDPTTGRYGKERIASFAGIVPSDEPRLSIVVVLDEPQEERYGGTAAAPVFREIAEGALRSLGVPPTRKVAASAPPPPQREDVSEGFVALAQPQEEEAGGETIPDLRGLGARAAVSRLGALGLEARIEGSGRVASQTPAQGSVAAPGAAVTLFLEDS